MALSPRTPVDPAPVSPGTPELPPLPPLLRRAWYGLNQAFRRRIAHLELTPDQYTVLRTLTDAGPPGLTQSELTGRMSSDPNTIASLVERMEAQGLLSRRTDPRDRRARRLRVAPSGRTRYRAARRVALVLQTEVMEVLPLDRRKTFLECLEALAGACRGAADRSFLTGGMEDASAGGNGALPRRRGPKPAVQGR